MASRNQPHAPDLYERVLAWAAVALGVVVIIAFVRGAMLTGPIWPAWQAVPLLVWLHLGTVTLALGLTPLLLLRRRGTQWHRQMGRLWIVAMTATAALSFAVHHGSGHFSVIHLLSALVLVTAPLAWRAAARHDVAQHRSTIRALVTGALLMAGLFTLLPSRLLGHWLFG